MKKFVLGSLMQEHEVKEKRLPQTILKNTKKITSERVGSFYWRFPGFLDRI